MEVLLSHEGHAKSLASRSKIEQVMVILVPKLSGFCSILFSTVRVCSKPVTNLPVELGASCQLVILCQRKVEASESILISQLTLPSPVRKFRGVRLGLCTITNIVPILVQSGVSGGLEV